MRVLYGYQYFMNLFLWADKVFGVCVIKLIARGLNIHSYICIYSTTYTRLEMAEKALNYAELPVYFPRSA